MRANGCFCSHFYFLFGLLMGKKNKALIFLSDHNILWFYFKYIKWNHMISSSISSSDRNTFNLFFLFLFLLFILRCLIELRFPEAVKNFQEFLS